MSTIIEKWSFGSAGKIAAVMALVTAMLGGFSGTATAFASKRGDIELREQTLKNSAEAADQRSKQATDAAQRQQKLIIDQIRRNREVQCRAARLPNC